MMVITIIGLPVIIPVGLVIFWVRCGRNMADNMEEITNKPDEPVAMVEHIGGLDKGSEIDFSYRLNHDKF
jgi:hypothetical protein